MRALFLAALLALGLAYLLLGLGLDFTLPMGRPGPGFFPRLIGTGLVVTCAISLAVELWKRRRQPTTESSSAYARSVVAVGLLSVLFIGALSVLGAALATGLYLIATLSLLNPGRFFKNVLISVGVAVFIVTMFDSWLKISLPEGVMGIIR